MITVSICGDVIKAFKEKTEYDGIVHGCNCFCNWGAGIAVDMRKNFGSAFKADQETGYGDKSKLGSFSYAETKYGVVINAYSQYHYGGGKVNCDYDAIRSIFTKLNSDYKGKVFAIPKIGAGHAKGNWKKIKSIINEVTPDIEIDVYYL